MSKDESKSVYVCMMSMNMYVLGLLYIVQLIVSATSIIEVWILHTLVTLVRTCRCIILYVGHSIRNC